MSCISVLFFKYDVQDNSFLNNNAVRPVI